MNKISPLNNGYVLINGTKVMIYDMSISRESPMSYDFGGMEEYHEPRTIAELRIPCEYILSREETQSTIEEAITEMDTLQEEHHRLTEDNKQLRKTIQELKNRLSRSNFEQCPDCEGGGIIPKLYPNGHTEARCDLCEGEGYIEHSGSLGPLDDLRFRVNNFRLR